MLWATKKLNVEIVPKLPTFLLLMLDPWASQQSSKIYRPWSSAILTISPIFDGHPSECTAMINFVLSVIAFFIAVGQLLYVSNSISTKTGTSPVCNMGEMTVVKVDAGTITSSPSFKYPACISAVSANRFAELPELQATPKSVPMYSEYSFSNCFTFGPWEIHISNNESITWLTSRWSIHGYATPILSGSLCSFISK